MQMGMINMELDDLQQPTEPGAQANQYKIVWWKIAKWKYKKQVDSWKNNTDRGYALVLGQYSQALRNQLEANKD